jgi:hypothetical protein
MHGCTRVYCRLQVRAAHGERRQNASLSIRLWCLLPAVLSHIYPRYIAPPAHLTKTQQQKRSIVYIIDTGSFSGCIINITGIETSEIRPSTIGRRLLNIFFARTLAKARFYKTAILPILPCRGNWFHYRATWKQLLWFNSKSTFSINKKIYHQ